MRKVGGRDFRAIWSHSRPDCVPGRPKRPERAYMNILQNVTRTILRSVLHLEMDDTVPGREHESGRPRHAPSGMPTLAL